MNESGDDPWDWMQAHDAQRFCEGILDSAQRERRCTAVFIGCLSYLSRIAADLRQGFDGLLDDRCSFDFKRLEMLWGSKP